MTKAVITTGTATTGTITTITTGTTTGPVAGRVYQIGWVERHNH